MTRPFAYLATCLALMTGAAAQAEIGLPAMPDNIARIEVLPGWRTAEGDHMTALRIRLAKGWKTYWRAPGDSGIPPSLDLRPSQNIQSVQFHWPVPEVFVENGVRTIGYKDEVILPITVTPRENGAPVTLEGQLQFGVCLDVCLPMQAHVAAPLADQGGANRAITRALRQRPDTAAEAGVTRTICKVEPIKNGLRVNAEIHMPRLGPDEVVVLETPDPSVWVAEVDSQRAGGRILAQTDILPDRGHPFLLNRAELRFTVLAAGRAVDIQGCTGS